MRKCARCNGDVAAGLLLCGRCVPRERLRQDVHITLTDSANAGTEGKAQDQWPGVTSKVTARERPASGGISRTPLKAVEKVEWIHDRQRVERRVWLFDKRDRAYRETCFHLDTGLITWGPKAGSLDDQSIHGPRHLGQRGT